MYICLCNAFSHKKVEDHLKNNHQGQKARVGEVYRACSGGETPGCCTCLETLKDIVKTHNKKQTATA